MASIIGNGADWQNVLPWLDSSPLGMGPESTAVPVTADIQTPGARELPNGAVTGDDDFYARFLAPVESRMTRTIWRLLRDRENTRDALQDAVATIWKQRTKIALHPNPEALILRICLNVACDSLRKQRRDRRLEAREIPACPIPNSAPYLLAGEELEKQVQAAIASLPPQQAAAVLMRVVEERPYAVIARALGCSTITARVHVMRGRARLRRLLARVRSQGRKKD